MRHRLLVGLGALAAAACTTTRTVTTTTEDMPTARAEMRDSAGRELGAVRVLFTSSGARLTGTLTGVPAGTHGFHFHQVGRCDATATPPFQSAGPHYNPAGRQHGTLNPEGPHAGDLPNVATGAGGRLVLPDSGVTVAMNETVRNGLFDADGSALVLHATADDYRTDPSGNSGARIACGVVSR
jgi:Cu-Zn family superoxide dismutase